MSLTAFNRTEHSAPNSDKVAEYLLQHNGPDDNRRASKTGKIHILDLTEGIEIAKDMGLNEGWKPWHFDQIDDKWIRDTDVVEALTAKFKSLKIIPEDFNPLLDANKLRIGKLCLLQAKQMETPLTVVVGERKFEVPISGLFALKFRSTTFEVVRWYIKQIQGEETASQLRPYHMAFSSRNTLKDPRCIAEVTGKKLKLVADAYFDADIFKAAVCASVEELSTPFLDAVGNCAVEVNTSSYFQKRPILSSIKLGLNYLGYSEFADSLMPYHRSKASNYTWDQNSGYRTKFLERYLDILCKASFAGDRLQMILNLSPIEHFQGQIFEYLTDPVSGKTRSVPISLSSLSSSYGNRRWDIIQAYLLAKNDSVLLKDLKPYHLKITPEHSTKGLKSYQNELLVKHLDALLNKGPYLGNRDKFIQNVTGYELQKPFIDYIAGSKIEVSTLTLYANYDSSPIKMLRSYLQLINQNRTIKDTERTNSPQRTSVNINRTKSVLFKCLSAAERRANKQKNTLEITHKLMQTRFLLPDGTKSISPASSWRQWVINCRQSNIDPIKTIMEEYSKQKIKRTSTKK